MCRINAFRATPREGIALPIALAAIVAIGALIAGVFFASTQEYRVGRNTLISHRALQSAEAGLSTVQSSWKPAWTTDTRVGHTVKLSDTTIDESLVQRQFTKVNPTTFWVTATAVAGGGSAQARSLKRLSSVIRVETPDFKIIGAITSRGGTNATGSATISGKDTVPAGWDCPEAGPQGAGIVVGDSATNASSGGGCTGFSCVAGSPKVKDSTALASDTMTYTKFGGFSYDSLTKLATKVLASGSVPNGLGPVVLADGVTCDANAALNWGDTLHVAPPSAPRPCQYYYPTVWLKGDHDWTLNGGGGQGILLVDGDLKINGKFKWTGIVIVRGAIKVNGSSSGGIKVVGAIAAMNRGNTGNSFSGNSSVQFSRCVINQVSAKLGVAATMKHRAWADLSF
jgi:hypothetical protein